MGKGQELLVSAREGDIRNVEKIINQITKRSGPFPSLRRGAGVNVQDDNGYTPLHHACLNRHKGIVRLLLSADASPSIVDKKGATPLHHASFSGDSDIVAMLLAHSNPPNVDQQTNNKETALLMAAQFGHVDVVALLMAHGADVTLKNHEDKSPLDLAAQFGRTEVVKLFIRASPQLIDIYKYPGNTIFPSTPLHRASRAGHKEIVSRLISAGIHPDIRTKDGTPLHEAVLNGKASVVRVLLANGANIHARDNSDKTVNDLLALHSQEATKRIRRVIQEHSTLVRNNYESEEEPPGFPVSPPGYSIPTAMLAPQIEKDTNIKNISLPQSSSSLTKNQSFVKKLASKCLGLKAKFNSAPNIPNSCGIVSEVPAKAINSEQKPTNTLHIGNSKFFKILLKKEESGDIICNDEFDTISLDRLGTLSRDSVVNRSNRSCPGFKTSLPNISEHTEFNESHDLNPDFVVIEESDIDDLKRDNSSLLQAVNYNAKKDIHHLATINNTVLKSFVYSDTENLVNECYESYEFSSDTQTNDSKYLFSLPRPPPRPSTTVNSNDKTIYENVTINKVVLPTPASRSNIAGKDYENFDKQTVYENVSLKPELKPDPIKRTIVPVQMNLNSTDNVSPAVSRSSTLSSDSMLDESNLEDILLSEKSKSFRHKTKRTVSEKSFVVRTDSVASRSSDSSDVTQASAMENIDCSDDVDKRLSLSSTSTMPSKKNTNAKNLFRHKTFNNIDVNKRLSVKDLPKWNCDFLKETLAHYHIKGTGHCIYKAPTVQEFINIFNRDNLFNSEKSFDWRNKKRDSYFETAICFCRPSPPKLHRSVGDLLEIYDDEETVSLEIKGLSDKRELVSTTFQCFCEDENCALHSKKREYRNNYAVKFSVVKKSISTPDITLQYSPVVTSNRSSLPKNKSVPSNLEISYPNSHLIREENEDCKQYSNNNPTQRLDSIYSTLSSTISSSSTRLYSIKDISDVISVNDKSPSTDTSLLSAFESTNLSLRKSSSSENSGHWSLQSCNSNTTIKSELSFKTCFEESSDDGSDGTLHSEEESSDAETIKSDISTTKRPWVHSNSFSYGNRDSLSESDVIVEEDSTSLKGTNSLVDAESSKFESGISVGFESSSSVCEDDCSILRIGSDVSLGIASLERGSGGVGADSSGLGRRRWDETEGTSEGDALSVSSAASSCAPHHIVHHMEYSKVSPTPPKKPPRRNLSVSPTHANSPSSGYSYELRTHARSQDDLDDIQSAKIYLKHGRSVDQYVDGKLSYSEYEENHHSPRVLPVPNPRPSLKNRSQPVAITAMYENVVIKEQNPRRKLRRNNFEDNHEQMDNRVRKYSHQERSSMESLLDSQSVNSPSDCERYYDGHRLLVPKSPTHYEQPPTPDHPPPSAKQAENSIHERIRPLSQLIMEVVEEIRIRKKSQADVSDNT